MDSLEELWGEGALRAFISHKAEVKAFATGLQKCLLHNGIASFVAHEDVEPTDEWQVQIMRALFSMDVLIALLTEEFGNSNWTDQEVGTAIGRNVLVIPVKIGRDPYGFIGKYQAVPGHKGTNQQIADRIYTTIQRHDSIPEDLKASVRLARDFSTDAYISEFIDKVSRSGDFYSSNDLSKLLPRIETLSPQQEQALVSAFNTNGQVNGAFRFESVIVYQLKRMTGHEYELDRGRLKRINQ